MEAIMEGFLLFTFVFVLPAVVVVVTAFARRNER